ncbi:MAG: 50S ribosomal protein L33 [Mycoplasma sp.]
MARRCPITKKIILICENCLSRNYHYQKNTMLTKRLILNKFCPHCNAKTVHKESK